MYDHRSSNVPVEVSAAITAVPTVGEGLCVDLAALRAFLRGPSRIDLYKLNTGTCSLVVEHCSQLCPRGIVNVPGEHTAGQAFDVEVFDGDPAETINQIAGQFVQVIAPPIGDECVMLGQSGDPLSSCRGATPAPGDSALASPQFTLASLYPIGTLDCLAVAQGDQAGKAKIDTDAIRRGAFDSSHLNVENDIPFTCLAGQDCAGRFCWAIPGASEP